MGLIEDVKRLGCPLNSAENCWYCGEDVVCGDAHKPTCPWLALPRIVQALEALEALRDSTVRLSRWWDTDPCFCRLCPETEDDHEERCLAVRDALTRLSGSLGMA